MKDLLFREFSSLIIIKDPLIDAFRQKLDSFEPGLSSNLNRIVELDPDSRRKVFEYILSAACVAQNPLNIDLGRATIIAMPRSWVLENLEAAAEPLLSDEWCYRRLLELCWKLDQELVQRLALRAVTDENAEIKELGRECLSQLNE
jgi:hypothetical protein